ncbi:MAG: hypothetical protein HRT35_22635 [Algicola sp.]|nr:hypothetical protein [Algicola sp.]
MTARPSKISLKNYDMVYAISQEAINEKLLQFVETLPLPIRQIQIHGKAATDNKLTIVKDPATADCSLTGQWDEAYNNLNIVDLNSPKGNKTLILTIAIVNGRFSQKQHPAQPSEFVANPIWRVKYLMDLTLRPAEKKLLIDRFEAVKDIDESIFIIEQLLLDTDSARFFKLEGVDMPPAAQQQVAELTKAYLQQLPERLIVGVCAKTRPGAEVPSNAFKPSWIDFCITPQLPGGPVNPNLDSLNYLLMSQNHPPPPQLPANFDENWIRNEHEHGRVGLAKPLFLDSMCQSLSSLLKHLSPEIYVAPGNKLDMRENQKNKFEFNRFTANPDNGHFAQYRYNSEKECCNIKDEGRWFGVDKIIDQMIAKYSIILNLLLQDNGVFCRGIMVLHASEKHTRTHLIGGFIPTPFPFPFEKELPHTTYEFSFKLEPVDAQMSHSHVLAYRITEPNFNKEPQVVKRNDFFTWLFVNHKEGLQHLVTGIREQITESNLQQLNDSLRDCGKFVFPGGDAFRFNKRELNNNNDLLTQLHYK